MRDAIYASLYMNLYTFLCIIKMIYLLLYYNINIYNNECC